MTKTPPPSSPFLEIVEDYPLPTCGAMKHQHKMAARCEKPPDHDEEHIGRTPRGYWHIWK